MTFRLKQYLLLLITSNFIKNSFWGLAGRLFEVLFLTLFFVIISRSYIPNDFAKYLISNNIYQLIVGFSSMGLGDWFIRELEQEADKNNLINRFLKIQIGLGLLFYFINIVLIFILYSDKDIRLLSLVLGTNIIFDNLIFALRSLNIAQSQQKKTAIIMAVDGFLKLIVSCLLLIYPFSIFTLSFFLVGIRLFTVNIFIKIGSYEKLNLITILYFGISFSDIKKHLLSNWRFVMIAGLSIVFWRSASIIISKFLELKDVANYEIAYKIFTLFMLLPIVASTTIYPKFVRYFADNDHEAIRRFYKIIFWGYTIFCLLGYAFIQAYAVIIIPYIFGNNYSEAAICVKEMFLTFLVFPTALMQANLLMAMKLEKLDMYFNIIALGVYFTGIFIGLYFLKSLAVINYSICSAFIVFHIAQSIKLSNLKITSLKSAAIFYLLLSFFVLTYKIIGQIFNPIAVFPGFLITCAVLLIIYIKNTNKDLFRLPSLQSDN